MSNNYGIPPYDPNSMDPNPQYPQYQYPGAFNNPWYDTQRQGQLGQPDQGSFQPMPDYNPVQDNQVGATSGMGMQGQPDLTGGGRYPTGYFGDPSTWDAGKQFRLSNPDWSIPTDPNGREMPNPNGPLPPGNGGGWLGGVGNWFNSGGTPPGYGQFDMNGNPNPTPRPTGGATQGPDLFNNPTQPGSGYPPDATSSPNPLAPGMQQPPQPTSSTPQANYNNLYGGFGQGWQQGFNELNNQQFTSGSDAFKKAFGSTQGIGQGNNFNWNLAPGFSAPQLDDTFKQKAIAYAQANPQYDFEPTMIDGKWELAARNRTQASQQSLLKPVLPPTPTVPAGGSSGGGGARTGSSGAGITRAASSGGGGSTYRPATPYTAASKSPAQGPDPWGGATPAQQAAWIATHPYSGPYAPQYMPAGQGSGNSPDQNEAIRQQEMAQYAIDHPSPVAGGPGGSVADYYGQESQTQPNPTNQPYVPVSGTGSGYVPSSPNLPPTPNDTSQPQAQYENPMAPGYVPGGKPPAAPPTYYQAPPNSTPDYPAVGSNPMDQNNGAQQQPQGPQYPPGGAYVIPMAGGYEMYWDGYQYQTRVAASGNGNNSGE